jgi:hypothetical protein
MTSHCEETQHVHTNLSRGPALESSRRSAVNRPNGTEELEASSLRLTAGDGGPLLPTFFVAVVVEDEGGDVALGIALKRETGNA